ncbi:MULTISPECIES: AAA family ATPase [unclassified Sphingomonas]|jgi:energy-coupling factor transporter ATP-binding protein EcfA2|uniref:AAA family ATPase n=2 Tax=unclassified Sphingomonas TaxID=196159 RepID=UPI000834F57E|nr:MULTISPECIES: AAA family ATPase [unclassified Sphingomonas]
MGKLADWCAGQQPWAIDAMQRAATSTTVTTENVDALVNRVALAHGLRVEGTHPCQSFDENTVVALAKSPDDVILHSIGPLQGLDRLVPGQILKFAIDGVTVIFGENGSGKSGYTRALRQLCGARKEPELQNDVFANGAEPTKSITYTYQQGANEPVSATWTEGEAKPHPLGGITLLDADNLRVYVESKNEILYLPPEVACVGRLADLYQAACAQYRSWIDANVRQYGASFGAHYQQGTTAAQLSARLQIATPEANLPTEEELRAAAVWTPELEAELERLGAQLVQGPAAVASRYDRIAAACTTAADDLGRSVPRLVDLVTDLDEVALRTCEEKKRIADTLRAEQIGSQPITATGSDPWKALFQLARQFAAEAGVRQAGEPFVAGDPCPLCQQSLSDDAAKRLAAFDAYIEGRATQEADAAYEAIQRRVATLRDLTFKTEAELAALLGETAAHGPEAALLGQQAVAFSTDLRIRRDLRVQQLEAGHLQPLSPLPASPIDGLRNLAATLTAEATALRSGDDQTARATARIAELSGQKQFHAQIDEAVARRHSLFATHRYKKCEAALNTGPLSRLITSLRKELTSPDLKARIEAEIAGFALTHVPFKFCDESERGISFFEVELATDKKAKKSRVLSEGEQRALSLACFLAETHVAGKCSGIILDDPVTSLDHGRVRRVARRLIDEAAKGRQIIIFTHNLVFYHELMLACMDRTNAVSALPCLIQQGAAGEFGIVSVGDEPWVARKVKDREHTLKGMIDAIPDDVAVTSDDYRRRCTGYYAALRETWERAVEEIVLNDVVRRFGSDVGTLRLAGVEVSDEDFMLVYRAMKRASEYSGHDQAAGRQIDTPTKDQMMADWHELVAFRATKAKANRAADERRKGLASAPPVASVA